VPFDGRAFDREISGEIDDAGVDAGPSPGDHDAGSSLPRDGGSIAGVDAGSTADGGGSAADAGGPATDGGGSSGDAGSDSRVVGGACQSGPGQGPWPLWLFPIAAFAVRTRLRRRAGPR
jgi:MYXO-CTERM domain-containing protein